MLTYQPTQLFTRSLARVLTYQSTHSFVSSIAQLLFDVLARSLDCLPDSFARLSPSYLLACSSLTWLARLLTGLPSCVLAHSLNYIYFVSRLPAYLLSFRFIYLIAGAHARPLARLLAHLPTESDSYLHSRVTWFLYSLACSLARRPSNLRLLGAAHDRSRSPTDWIVFLHARPSGALSAPCLSAHARCGVNRSMTDGLAAAGTSCVCDGPSNEKLTSRLPIRGVGKVTSRLDSYTQK